MKLSNSMKKFFAYVCAIAMVVSSMTFYGQTSVKAKGSVAVDGKVYTVTDGDATIAGFTCQGIFDKARIHFAWGTEVDAASITTTVNGKSVKIDGTNAHGMFIPLSEVSTLAVGEYQIVVSATATENSATVTGNATLKIEDEGETTTRDPSVKVWIDLGDGFSYDDSTTATVNNIQQPDWSPEKGIYVNVPAGISSVAVNGKTGDEVTKQVNETGEEKFTTAKEELKPEENDALYYTLTSTKAGTPSGEIRQSMLEFASQFVGNPYVWGGTSLTDGADCSGFVQQIYKQYGYDLPRVAADQAQYGTKIAVEDAQPGDLIFYAKDGDIHHVVMYAGNGKTIEAANENDGIIYGNVDTTEAVWATRILNDQYSVAGAGIGEVNATEDMYGQCLGNFKITYYCACEICCDVETGITATGTPVVEGQTIAVDPNVIPYGTKVIIGGHVFTAEDCGGAIKENRIDVYVNNHADALALGVTNADVYLVK